jgi:protein TonB
MFGEVVVRPAARNLARGRWPAWPVSLAAHTIAIGALFVIPLVSTPVLPVVPSFLAAYVGLPVEPPQPPPPRVVKVGPLPDAVKSLLTIPTEAPTGIQPETGIETTVADRTSSGPEPGIVPGSGASVLDALPRVALPPPPPSEPVRPGGHIVPPRKIVDVQPIYPPLAQMAHVEGVVVLEAIIGTAGEVEDVRVLRSVPLLDQAALDAVRQWRYTPTLLNGVPVRVIMTVTVNFKLKDEV